VNTRIISYPFPDGTTHGPSWGGKFLQLLQGGDEVVLFAPFERFDYHNQLLAHFLGLEGIPYQWRDIHLEFGADGLSVVGGGRFRIDEPARLLLLWDRSDAYGRFDAEGLTERIADAGHTWSDYRVRIG